MTILSYIVPIVRIYLVGLRVLLYQLFSNPFKLPVMPRQDGRVAIVTGGAGGIGHEIARHMASLGAHVIIGGRDELEGLTAVRRICQEHTKAKVEYEKLDLASLKSVRLFVQIFKGRGLPLHILVNNAGVMLVPEGSTEEGFEQHLGVNYLGHFLLTSLLLDTLKDSGKCGSCSRVISVSSSAHRAGEIHLDDLQGRQCYSAHAAYCQSKLALLLFSSHLQGELSSRGHPVSSSAVDPGMVDTALYRHLSPLLRPLHSPVARLLFRTPAEGAATVLYAALSPALEVEGGGYWANGRREMTSPAVHDLRLQRKLWEDSRRLVGLVTA